METAHCRLLCQLVLLKLTVECHVAIYSPKVYPDMQRQPTLMSSPISLGYARSHTCSQASQLWQAFLQEVYSLNADIRAADAQLVMSCIVKCCPIVQTLDECKEKPQDFETHLQAALVTSTFTLGCLWQSFPEVKFLPKLILSSSHAEVHSQCSNFCLLTSAKGMPENSFANPYGLFLYMQHLAKKTRVSQLGTSTLYMM